MGRIAMLAMPVLLMALLSGCDMWFPAFGVEAAGDGSYILHPLYCRPDEVVTAVRLEDTGVSDFEDLPGRSRILWEIVAGEESDGTRGAIRVDNDPPPGFKVVFPLSVDLTAIPPDQYLRISVRQTYDGRVGEFHETFQAGGLPRRLVWFRYYEDVPTWSVDRQVAQICKEMGDYYGHGWIGDASWTELGLRLVPVALCQSPG